MYRHLSRRIVPAALAITLMVAAAPAVAQICTTAKACYRVLVADLIILQIYEYECVTSTVCI